MCGNCWPTHCAPSRATCRRWPSRFMAWRPATHFLLASFCTRCASVVFSGTTRHATPGPGIWRGCRTTRCPTTWRRWSRSAWVNCPPPAWTCSIPPRAWAANSICAPSPASTKSSRVRRPQPWRRLFAAASSCRSMRTTRFSSRCGNGPSRQQAPPSSAPRTTASSTTACARRCTSGSTTSGAASATC